jgi:hypothetical protein
VTPFWPVVLDVTMLKVDDVALTVCTLAPERPLLAEVLLLDVPLAIQVADLNRLTRLGLRLHPFVATSHLAHATQSGLGSSKRMAITDSPLRGR